MTLRQFDQPDELALVLATDILSRVQQTPSIVIGFATGRTPTALYRELRDRSRRSHVDWSQVRTFNLDEFVDESGGGTRYREFMHRELFDHVNLRDEHIHLLNGRAPNLIDECERYEAALAVTGGIDLQILGLGVNGHIGFNEPSDALQSRTHVARLEDATRDRNVWLFEGHLDRVPRQGLSMGMGTIFGAREIALLATGSEKAAAVQRMLEGPVTTRFPASFLQLHANVTVMLDAAAAPLTRR